MLHDIVWFTSSLILNWSIYGMEITCSDIGWILKAKNKHVIHTIFDREIWVLTCCSFLRKMMINITALIHPNSVLVIFCHWTSNPKTFFKHIEAMFRWLQYIGRTCRKKIPPNTRCTQYERVPKTRVALRLQLFTKRKGKKGNSCAEGCGKLWRDGKIFTPYLRESENVMFQLMQRKKGNDFQKRSRREAGEETIFGEI